MRILMGGAGRHCHCKAPNFCPHAQVLPGVQTIKVPYVFSDVGKFKRIMSETTVEPACKVSVLSNEN